MLRENIHGYSLALFSLAVEEKKLKNIKEDSQAIIEAISHNEEIEHILSSKILDRKKKDDLVDKAFKNIDKNIKTFIKIIFNKGLGVYIIPVLEKLIKLVNESQNIKEGIIYTIEPLSNSEILKLEKKVEKKLGYKPSLKNKIDPSLVAGFKIIVNDEKIEDSVLSRLDQLKNELLERKEN